MRLNNGTENIILNAAFQLAFNENHMWVHAVYHVVNHNGFKKFVLTRHLPKAIFMVLLNRDFEISTCNAAKLKSVVPADFLG